MINFIIEDSSGHEIPLAIPDGIELTLMEVLKASDMPILATCGGMALCATCRVKVVAGEERLPAPGNVEQDMLDTLPFSEDAIRLSCQLRIDEYLEACRFALIND